MSSKVGVIAGTFAVLMAAVMLLSADYNLYGGFASMMKLAGVALIVLSVKIGKWISTL